MNRDPIALLDQGGQAPGVLIGMLLFLGQGELKDLALQLDRPLAASLARQERAEPQLVESPLDLIEAFPAEAELAAGLRNGVFIDRMGAQHLVFDLRQIVGVKEIPSGTAPSA